METNERQIRIIHEPTLEEPFLVLSKPRGLPSAPIKIGDESALTQAIGLYPELDAVNGKKKIERGLVHRIDNETEGLLLIAASDEFYEYIQKIQDEEKFIKTYEATCFARKNINMENMEGFPASPVNIDINAKKINCLIQSRFRAFGTGRKEVRPVTELSGRAALKKTCSNVYETFVSGSFSDDKTKFNAKCTISKGYRHQVRCHLAWIGFPIVGDPVYSRHMPGNDTENFCFKASGFSFPYHDGKTVSFSY